MLLSFRMKKGEGSDVKLWGRAQQGRVSLYLTHAKKRSEKGRGAGIRVTKTPDKDFSLKNCLVKKD